LLQKRKTGRVTLSGGKAYSVVESRCPKRTGADKGGGGGTILGEAVETTGGASSKKNGSAAGYWAPE